jgi:AcrR family transcriptional regulator
MHKIQTKRGVDPFEDAAATRAKLLQAAGLVFAEQGFQAATVRDICTRAKVNIAAINYHFRDKLGLYTEVLRHAICVAEHAAMREALSASKSPEEALRSFISIMLRKMSASERSGWAMRIMAHEFAQPTPALDQVIEEVIRPNYGKLREIVGRILDRDPDDEATRLCAHSVIGQIIHYALARPVIKQLWPELEWAPKNMDRVAAHISEFSLNSLKAMAKSEHRKNRRKRK